MTSYQILKNNRLIAIYIYAIYLACFIDKTYAIDQDISLLNDDDIAFENMQAEPYITSKYFEPQFNKWHCFNFEINSLEVSSYCDFFGVKFTDRSVRSEYSSVVEIIEGHSKKIFLLPNQKKYLCDRQSAEIDKLLEDVAAVCVFGAMFDKDTKDDFSDRKVDSYFAHRVKTMKGVFIADTDVNIGVAGIR